MSLVYQKAAGTRAEVIFGTGSPDQVGLNYCSIGGWFYVTPEASGTPRLWRLASNDDAYDFILEWDFSWANLDGRPRTRVNDRTVFAPSAGIDLGAGKWLGIYACFENYGNYSLNLYGWDENLTELFDVNNATVLWGTVGGSGYSFTIGGSHGSPPGVDDSPDEVYFRTVRVFSTYLSKAEALAELASKTPVKLPNAHAAYGLANAADNNDNSGNDRHLTLVNGGTGDDPPIFTFVYNEFIPPNAVDLTHLYGTYLDIDDETSGSPGPDENRLIVPYSAVIEAGSPPPFIGFYQNPITDLPDGTGVSMCGWFYRAGDTPGASKQWALLATNGTQTMGVYFNNASPLEVRRKASADLLLYSFGSPDPAPDWYFIAFAAASGSGDFDCFLYDSAGNNLAALELGGVNVAAPKALCFGSNFYTQTDYLNGSVCRGRIFDGFLTRQEFEREMWSTAPFRTADIYSAMDYGDPREDVSGNNRPMTFTSVDFSNARP